MIVADANLIAALIVGMEETAEYAEGVLLEDRDWAAPVLWRSEFCNILATANRNGVMSLAVAEEALYAAQAVMEGSEFTVSSVDTLRLASKTGCTAYDSEYALLAMELDVQLVTFDKKLLRELPEVAIHPRDYLNGSDND